MPSSSRFSMFLYRILCLISNSTKTIRLLALDFYEAIVDSGFALINYHLIEISSRQIISYNLQYIKMILCSNILLLLTVYVNFFQDKELVDSTSLSVHSTFRISVDMVNVPVWNLNINIKKNGIKKKKLSVCFKCVI